ncbi:MAG TPA: diguanylate cyclase, partial [Thermoanaerobaculia bacterium]|nr:diguanylate cyclase [Thermoanaerobaculia bacterium]
MRDNDRRDVAAERDEFASIAAQHARDLIAVLDPDQRILWASPSYRDVLGYEPEAMAGHGASEFIHRDDVARQAEAHRHRMTKRATTIIEVRLLRADGTSLEVESVGVPVLSGEGQVHHVVVTSRDISDRKNLDRRLRLLLEQIPANVWTTDRDLRITSSAGRAVSEDFMSGAVDVHERVLRGEPLSFETRWRERDLHVRIHPLRNEHADIVGTIGIALDVTDQRRAERRFKALFERNVAGVFRSTLRGRLIECNEAFAKMCGYELVEEMLKIPTPALYFNESDRQTLISLVRTRGEATNFEVRLRRKDGKPVWLLLNEFVTMSEDVGEETLEGTAVDITARKLAEERIEYQAYHDSLTDLPNRFLLNDRLVLALAQARRHGRAVAVLFLDLDHFKLINDSMAHSAGDELLRSAAARLLTCLRAEDTVARIGGDEFVFILPGIEHTTAPAGAARVAEKLLEALRHPFIVQDRELFVTASIGIAISPHDGEDIETLVKNAD